jgi:hypothetical protein
MVLQRRNEIKIEEVLGEDHFGFRRGKELELLRIILGRLLEVDEKLCACFIDRVK